MARTSSSSSVWGSEPRHLSFVSSEVDYGTSILAGLPFFASTNLSLFSYPDSNSRPSPNPALFFTNSRLPKSLTADMASPREHSQVELPPTLTKS